MNAENDSVNEQPPPDNNSANAKGTLKPRKYRKTATFFLAVGWLLAGLNFLFLTALILGPREYYFGGIVTTLRYLVNLNIFNIPALIFGFIAWLFRRCQPAKDFCIVTLVFCFVINPSVGLFRLFVLTPSPVDSPRTRAALTDTCLPGVTAPSEEAAEKFARRLEEAIKAGDRLFLDSSVDLDLLVNRAFSWYGFSQTALDNFKRGLADNPNRIGDTLSTYVKEGGDVKYLRIHKVGNETRALFRLVSGTAKLNYSEFILAERKGATRISDVYVFSQGELLSVMIRWWTLAELLKATVFYEGSLSSDEQEYMESWTDVSELLEAYAADDPDRVLAMYGRLPFSVRKNRLIMYKRRGAARRKGLWSMEYSKAAEDMENLFPNDVSTHLAFMGYYNDSGHYAKAYASIDALEKAIGGDAYLEVLRGHVNYREKKYDQAMAAYERAIEMEPTLKKAYLSELRLLFRQGKWVEATLFLIRSEENVELSDAELQTVRGMLSYKLTKEYRQWKTLQQEQEKPINELE